MLSGTRRPISVTIPTAADGLSAEIDLEAEVPVALEMSAAWTAAALTFLGATETGGTFTSMFDDDAAEVSIASAKMVAGTAITFRAALVEALKGFRYIKLRSGVDATPVQQAAARTLTLMVRQL